MKQSALLILFIVVLSAKLNAQPPDEIIKTDTIHVGDTICFADTVKKYVAEFYYPNGKTATVRGVTPCIEAASRAPSGTRIYVKQLEAENRSGKKVYLKRRAYYIE